MFLNNCLGPDNKLDFYCPLLSFIDHTLCFANCDGLKLLNNSH